ncbi:MAG TPA: PadR family transcriptional regulator [Thermotogota bacterium]|nr:PadR family transcriptional regulator [Thermotogota bacterium]HRW35452.1 PadR family transcriptional regulator [Thermotogota bacterium]
MPQRGYGRGRGASNFGRRWQSAFILLIIAESPTHGYEIAQKLDDFGCLIKSTGQMGGMYRLLSDLEEEGLILADWETDKPGPAKKIYKITNAGINRLFELESHFTDLKKTIEDFHNRVSEIKTSDHQ